MVFKAFCKLYGGAFAAGIATAIVGGKILKSQCVRKAVVKTMAKGMMLKDEASAAVQKIKEESQDIYEEAVIEKAKASEAKFAKEAAEAGVVDAGAEATAEA